MVIKRVTVIIGTDDVDEDVKNMMIMMKGIPMDDVYKLNCWQNSKV